MPTRQLAAIMFVGLVDSSHLMQEDEEMAIIQLEKLKKKLEEEAEKHKGRVLEVRGDGALCSFNSTHEAVHAALDLQLEMQEDPKVPLRIAIHTGDVIIDEDTIYGDGVNIASRIESLAVPGSIIISSRVYDDIKNQQQLEAIPLGRFVLKHVREPVDLYAIKEEGIITPEAIDLEGKGEKTTPPSILVLPFINVSSEAEQDYFSDGLTEELISNLSRLKDLRVISRTTSMQYKGTVKDIKSIAHETRATYIMEGSVRTHSNLLRISVQVVDGKTEAHIWSDAYRGTLDDIFDIQETVAAKIVEALRVKLTLDDLSTLSKRATGNTEAYQLYLQGRFLWNKRNETSLTTAIKFFELAIQKDPLFAQAWVGVADTYNLLGESTIYSRRDLYPKAKAAVDRALEIDPGLAEAHISLALMVMLNEWNWGKSGREFRTGIRLNPNYATGHHWYSQWLLFMGRMDEALDEISLAVELDPVSQAILRDHGMTLYYDRQYDLAIEKANKTFELDKDFIAAHRLLSLCYQGKEMYAEAIRENKIWGDLIKNEVKYLLALAQIHAASGLHQEALDIIQDLKKRHKAGSNDYRSMGIIYASMGDGDTAFRWLEKSYERHEESLCSIKVDPKLNKIRNDPRYGQLVKKIGLI